MNLIYCLLFAATINAAVLEYDGTISTSALISKLSNIGIYAAYDGKHPQNAFYNYLPPSDGKPGHLELTIYTSKQEVPTVEVKSSSTSVILTDIDAEVTK